MNLTHILLSGGIVSCMATAAPVPILNFSGEINNGVDRAPVSDPSVIGWDGSGTAQVIDGGTDYGNGRWRLSIEDSAEAWQMTSHGIAAGDSFSLRFDAAMFAGNLPGGGSVFVAGETLVGGATRNGDFNDPAGVTGSRNFTDTPGWYNLGGSQAAQATNSDLPFDGTRNAVLAENGLRKFAVDTGHTLVAGESFRAGFVWRDAGNWNDATDSVAVSLYTTADDTVSGSRTVLQTLQAPVSTLNDTYEQAQLTFSPVGAAAAGKRLFAFFEGTDGDGNTAGFARLDNFVLERGTYQTTSPPRQIIAELYVDNGGSRLPVASRTYDFTPPVIGTWNHYHLAVPAGALDAHAGKTVGVRFRSNNQAAANFQSFDNVRLDVWPAGSPNGAFSDNWDNLPDQTWAGPGYWANRLQDWQVSAGRVQCINGTRDQLTLHRPGTSIRGNGWNFSLSVRTGLNTGSHNAGSRAGFLLGAGPNLDWRAALLVHDGLGRDFGLFLGITGGGNLVIEDYSTGAVTALATAAASGGFAQDTRLELAATYNSSPGTYTLTLTGTITAQTTIRVFPGRNAWNAVHFSAAEFAAPLISGGSADPDGDGFTNDQEYRFQTNPRDASARPVLSGKIVNDGGVLRADFSSSYPLDATDCTLFVESSTDLTRWTRLPSNSFTEISRDNLPATGTNRITIRLNVTLPGPEPSTFYRAGWNLP